MTYTKKEEKEGKYTDKAKRKLGETNKENEVKIVRSGEKGRKSQGF